MVSKIREVIVDGSGRGKMFWRLEEEVGKVLYVTTKLIIREFKRK